MGLAFAAALLAVLLGPVAGTLPVAEARAAGTDLTLVGDATYTVLPDQGRVGIAVDFTVRNHKSETKTTKYYFDRASLAVLPGTTNFHVTGWTGSKVRVTKRTSTYTMLQIDFGSRLYSGKAHALRLTFDLPDPGRVAKGQVRIGPSLVTFPVWAFASDGARGSTVSVRFPAGYDVAVESGSFDRRITTAGGATVLQTGTAREPAHLLRLRLRAAAGGLRDTPLAVTAGSQTIALTLQAWEDDPGWPARVGPLLEGALPVLRRDIGVPWPYADPLVVQEAVSRNAGGYAGLFDGGAGRIEVAYWAQPLVVVHEAAHGWFNGGLLADRWANEGFASLYAGRAATELKVKGSGPALTDEIAKAAIPLNAWASDGSADTRGRHVRVSRPARRWRRRSPTAPATRRSSGSGRTPPAGSGRTSRSIPAARNAGWLGARDRDRGRAAGLARAAGPAGGGDRPGRSPTSGGRGWSATTRLRCSTPGTPRGPPTRGRWPWPTAGRSRARSATRCAPGSSTPRSS